MVVTMKNMLVKFEIRNSQQISDTYLTSDMEKPANLFNSQLRLIASFGEKKVCRLENEPIFNVFVTASDGGCLTFPRTMLAVFAMESRCEKGRLAIQVKCHCLFDSAICQSEVTAVSGSSERAENGNVHLMFGACMWKTYIRNFPLPEFGGRICLCNR
jgi:hypothetical protein